MSHAPQPPRALAEAATAAHAWLASLDTRPVNATHDVDQVEAALARPFPQQGADPADVVRELVAAATPGLVATPSGRYFGWVRGGVLDSALAADWLTAAWDQNASLLAGSPAGAAVERVATTWLLDALHLPPTAAVGFVTGGQMANFTCLAAARHAVLARAGWDVERDGLLGAPAPGVFVGAERHVTVDLALRYLGLGQSRSVVVAADDQGRLRPDALEQALAADEQGHPGRPRIVVLQAGDVHSGAFDPGEAVAIAHRYGAWVHVDGAFGLWAAASPRHRHLTAGLEGADSWATDAHKTLNVPYDSGLAIVADPAALHAAMGERAAYLIQDERPDPLAAVPEFSRRARGFTVWAALRELGRDGLAAMVAGFADHAARFARELAALDGVTVVNDVVYTQVCVAFRGDVETRAVAAALLREGTTWMTPSTWRGRSVLRVSVSNARTDDDDVARAIAALTRVLGEVRAG
ncbi:pyridoxal phosphate-dependent decarboxylase family protein [Litorihabitans aurantiacus]|uniref:Aspartate aminotransferase family protein n=1 Tax=Litorihabitans aurantiacus TaxID=1930061 RepID=A0AA37XGE1_9MICO|nr:pyridoxal-dependent decarboxylase [Litorihabitans aurantiacus]GMA32850.1 aspartate aminotransferase family protein [Litorihabitans aurantiacus]